MKKNRVFVLFIFLLFYLEKPEATEIFYSFDPIEQILVCNLAITPFKTKDIVDAMKVGHRSEIEFIIRVYEDDKKKILDLPTRKIFKEISVSFVSVKDIFTNTYYITDSRFKNDKIEKTTLESFWDCFFSVKNLIINMSKAPAGNYYIAGRAKMKLIKLVPPLHLLSTIIPGIVEKTEWINIGSFRIDK